MPSYTCPDCNAKVKLAKEAQPGQELTCSECDGKFTPRAKTIAFKDDPPAKARATAKPAGQATTRATAKPATAKPAAASPPPPPPEPARKSPFAEDEDDGPQTYGLAEESEEEKRLAEKNKPVFGNIKDKYAKSARGPAAALLVTPVNLLLFQGGLLCLFGLFWALFWQGLWGIIFTGGTPPSDEEFTEYLGWVFVGIVCTLWGGITCYGAVQAITLGSYPWAVVAGFFGLFPLLAGIFMLLTIWDPRVLAGFAEPETGPIKVEAEKEKDDEDEDEEDEEEDEDEEEEEEEEEKPRKKRR
jgi:DNA-directed RNA polymerase subunit RPC12/RpoP